MSNKRNVITEEEMLRRRLVHAKRIKTLFEDEGSTASQMVATYSALLDLVLWDVAQETHREFKTTPQTTTRAEPSAAAAAAAVKPEQPQPAPFAPPAAALPPPPAGSSGRVLAVDVFGQTHPATATELVICRNCGRQIAAGKFAPHLEKCLGKGRAASRNASRRMAGIK